MGEEIEEINKMRLKTFLCLTVYLIVGYCHAYKILSILPLPWKSHYRIFDPLMVELARRGHQVTVVNPFPKSVKIPNYTEISLKECFPDNQFMFTIDDTIRMVESLYETANEFSQYVDVEERLYNSCLPIIQLVRSDERYDLVMTELFASDTFLPFVNKFQAPWIGLCANVLTPWTAHRINEVDNPSFVQTMLNIRPMNPRKSTFYERLYNTYIYVALKAIYYFVIEPKCQKVAEKYVGQYVDGPLSNVVTNVSLILSYSNFITNLPGPHSPIVKQIGGIHISEAKPLDQDIKEFIENSKHGVIYFSMGSILRTSTFSEHKRNAFVRAFARLPQRVLWKWEGEFPNQTENIKIKDWMPQRDILAHPNVKLFIAHGGSLGLNEAIYEGVPVLGIPIFGDQPMNILTLKTAGAADMLDYKSISDETVFEKLHTLLNDPSYATNAKKLSELYKDRPMSAMDTAVYWIEYVGRHNGAHHLRSASVHLTWYQYLLLDVIAFVTIIVISFLLILYYIFKVTISYINRRLKYLFCKVKQS